MMNAATGGSEGRPPKPDADEDSTGGVPPTMLSFTRSAKSGLALQRTAGSREPEAWAPGMRTKDDEQLESKPNKSVRFVEDEECKYLRK